MSVEGRPLHNCIKNKTIILELLFGSLVVFVLVSWLEWKNIHHSCSLHFQIHQFKIISKFLPSPLVMKSSLWIVIARILLILLDPVLVVGGSCQTVVLPLWLVNNGKDIRMNRMFSFFLSQTDFSIFWTESPYFILLMSSLFNILFFGSLVLVSYLFIRPSTLLFMTHWKILLSIGLTSGLSEIIIFFSRFSITIFEKRNEKMFCLNDKNQLKFSVCTLVTKTFFECTNFQMSVPFFIIFNKLLSFVHFVLSLDFDFVFNLFNTNVYWRKKSMEIVCIISHLCHHRHYHHHDLFEFRFLFLELFLLYLSVCFYCFFSHWLSVQLRPILALFVLFIGTFVSIIPLFLNVINGTLLFWKDEGGVVWAFVLLLGIFFAATYNVLQERFLVLIIQYPIEVFSLVIECTFTLNGYCLLCCSSNDSKRQHFNVNWWFMTCYWCCFGVVFSNW
jgi:hypothetical protein